MVDLIRGILTHVWDALVYYLGFFLLISVIIILERALERKHLRLEIYDLKKANRIFWKKLDAKKADLVELVLSHTTPDHEAVDPETAAAARKKAEDLVAALLAIVKQSAQVEDKTDEV